jgi:hypothetical protein
MSDEFVVPSELELLEFFGADPSERSEDGYYCYEVADARGVTLRFSFDVLERSVQTVLSVDGASLCSVSHENATRVRVREGALWCDFSSADSKAKLAVELYPRISIRWSSLRTA